MNIGKEHEVIHIEKPEIAKPVQIPVKEPVREPVRVPVKEPEKVGA